MRETELESLTGEQVPLTIEDRMYIDGEFIEGQGTISTEHPATGEPLADVPVATESQVDRAVRAAERASEEWRTLEPMERKRRVDSFAELCEKHETTLTSLEIADNGSSIARMQYDVEKAAESMRYYAGLAPELKGEHIPTGEGTIDFTKREPYGAVAGIIPFNHPLLLALQRIAVAVVAGNGIVVKPSERTPLSILYAARLLDDTDLFPDGLVNVVTGGGEVGEAITKHPDVGFVSFIGHVETGKAVMQSAATHLAPTMLGTGGKNPVVVFPDADVESAADGATDAMSLAWQGQSCGSGSRLLLHEENYDDVLERVVENVESIDAGDPFDEETTMGSIVSESQFRKVLDAIEQAESEGAIVRTGGSAIDEYDTGYFIEPTVLEVEPDADIAKTETFGPVLSVIKWNGYDEMLSIANGTRYGLTASVWTNDLSTAHRAIEDLKAGYIWVNQHGPHYTGAPFGGYKESGIGKKDSLQHLLDHTRVKNANIAIGDIENAWK